MTSVPHELTAINVPDLSPADDAFTQLATRHALRWVGLSGQPANALERGIRDVRLSRYRAAAQAALRAGPGSFVVSHLPLMTAAVAQALRLRRHTVPHLGFACNFTELPTGQRLRYLQGALRRVDRLVVFSDYERGRYAQYFGIDPQRFETALWAPEALPVQVVPAIPVPTGPYLCAIGSEGRDFPLLMQVARALGPVVAVVVIAWPDYLAGLSVPDNVQVLSDLSPSQVWQVARGSCGVLVPLLSRETCCGHITLVGAKLNGLPLATTYAYATREYVEGRAAVLECEPGDAAGFADLARRLFEEAASLRTLAQVCQPIEIKIHDRSVWAECLDGFIQRCVL